MRCSPLALAAVALAACGGPAVDGSYVAHFALLEVAPLSGPSTGGTQTTLRGLRVCPGLQVLFDDAPAEKVEVVSDQTAIAVTPAHARGEAIITAVCGDERRVYDKRFRYFASEVRFQQELAMPEGIQVPRDVLAFADLDGDGLDDLVVAGGDAGGMHPAPYSFSVKAFRNDGRNGFASEPMWTYELPSNEVLLNYFGDILDIADFTGDGTPDVLVISRHGLVPDPLASSGYSNDLHRALARVLLGDRGYASSDAVLVEPEGADEVQVLASEDLNGDHLRDLAVYFWKNSVGSWLQVWEATGAGTFRPGQRLPWSGFAQRSPWPLDVNGDGLNDLVLNTNLSLAILLGDAQGAYRMAEYDPPVPWSASARSGVLFYDGDSLPDYYELALSGAELTLSIWRATAMGTFEASPATYRIPCANPDQCGWAGARVVDNVTHDADADGTRELLITADALEWVVLSRESDNAPVLRLADGERARDAAVPLGMAKMRLDRGPQLVFQEKSGARYAAYLDGLDPANNFGSSFSSPFAFRPWPALSREESTDVGWCAADFTGDGIVDLVIVAFRYFSFRRGLGGGRFAPSIEQRPTFGTWGLGGACLVGEFGGDSLPDFRVGSDVFLNRGGGRFEQIPRSVEMVLDLSPPIAQLDTNRDGIDDLIVQGLDPRGGSDLDPLDYRIMQGSPEGAMREVARFAQAPPYGCGPQRLPTCQREARVADFNRDGIPDFAALVSAAEGHTVMVSLGAWGAGGRTVEFPGPPLTRELATVLVDEQITAPLSLADLDGDGVPEIIVRGQPMQVFRYGGSQLERVATLEAKGGFLGACNLAGRPYRDLLMRSGPHELTLASAEVLPSPSRLGEVPLRFDRLWLAEPIHAPFWDKSPCADLDGDGLDDLVIADGEGGGTLAVFNVSR